MWFQGLHPTLKNAQLSPFPNQDTNSLIQKALAYDRPDIILSADSQPLLVVERTIEVPSGHNVGQRFARLVAGARMKIPLIYFGPYAAYKHGGKTQGPRYMNLRLFYALIKLAELEKTVITILNWPVDKSYEIIQNPDIRDLRIQEYLRTFLDPLIKRKTNIAAEIKNSHFEKLQEQERQEFIKSQVVDPDQYALPPDSVIIDELNKIGVLKKSRPKNLTTKEIVFYNVGMKYIRSDPYTGMAFLYSYLYCGGLKNRIRNLVLYFPNISIAMWKRVANQNRPRKDIKIYKLTGDGILFSDGYVAAPDL